ncbi:HPr kinase/phosphorylase [Planococcaceae bacterium Storch 2/2-2]|nr:HPr kinase/phosphorylase [Planococcaceae bacterium Storch 2/2-2]
MDDLTVRTIVDEFQLDVVCGEEWLDREITTSDISRPGLEMAGFFDYYPAERVQLLGKKELTYLDTLPALLRESRLEQLCLPITPAFVVAHDQRGPEELTKIAKHVQVPILRTPHQTTRFAGMLTNFLEGRLAPMTTLHGVLVDVYGVGVLLFGKSGVGKSETALELVKRGHRLVADDVVEIRQVAKNVLIGNAPKMLEHMLEIRGVGIIDLMALFGASAVKDNKRILLAIELETWDPDKVYDRLGIDEMTTKIIDSEIPKLTVPVKPGRNLSVIIEVAAMDYRMKQLGINAAEKFTQKLEETVMKNAEKEERRRDGFV